MCSHISEKDTHGKCISCRRLWQSNYAKRHPERINASHRRYKALHSEKVRNYGRKFEYLHDFGITIADYDRMFTAQNGRCAICKRHQSEFKKRLAVDHNHITNAVRGLLCDPCNRGLGMLGEKNLEQALDYLKKEFYGI